MDKKNKIRVVNELLVNLRSGIMEKIEDMPEEWDGTELRQFIYDYYFWHFLPSRHLTGKRREAYRNLIIAKPLV